MYNKEDNKAKIEADHKKEELDYGAQINYLRENLKAQEKENINCNDKINCLTHDKLKLEVVLEEASQEASMSPDSKLSKAVADCKKSKSGLSRLNKTCDDMDWWREKMDGEVKPLRNVRKPIDFNGQTNVSSRFGSGSSFGDGFIGENLADFIPKHIPSMEDKNVETDDLDEIAENKISSPMFFQGSLLINLVFFGFILYLAMFTGAREFLIEVGVFKVEYNQEFSKYF
jgi:hypothetical protein